MSLLNEVYCNCISLGTQSKAKYNHIMMTNYLCKSLMISTEMKVKLN